VTFSFVTENTNTNKLTKIACLRLQVKQIAFVEFVSTDNGSSSGTVHTCDVPRVNTIIRRLHGVFNDTNVTRFTYRYVPTYSLYACYVCELQMAMLYIRTCLLCVHLVQAKQFLRNNKTELRRNHR